MTTLTISLAQMQIFPGETDRNRENFRQMLDEAAERQSELVVFPELWSTGYVLEQAQQHASALGAGIFEEMSAAAAERGMALVGSVLEKDGADATNSAAFFDADGALLGVYRKLHLFRLFDEHLYLQPGQTPLTLDLPWGKAGMAICYDLRFPELFRQYAIDAGAQLFIIPAEWPLARVQHWRALLIARAIENQCYVVACNAAGAAGETVMGGHSMIVDPWGEVLVEGGETPELLTAQIELALVPDVRGRIPIFEDVRRDVYGQQTTT